MFVRFASDMASATGSSITGLNGVSLPLRNVNQMRPMRSQSTTSWIDTSKNGSPTPPIFIHHPERIRHEVQYEAHVVDEMDNVVHRVVGFAREQLDFGALAEDWLAGVRGACRTM